MTADSPVPFGAFTSFPSPSLSPQTNFWNLYFPLELSIVFFSVCFNCIILSGMVLCPFSCFLRIVLLGNLSFYFFQRFIFLVVYFIILSFQRSKSWTYFSILLFFSYLIVSFTLTCPTSFICICISGEYLESNGQVWMHSSFVNYSTWAHYLISLCFSFLSEK